MFSQGTDIIPAIPRSGVVEVVSLGTRTVMKQLFCRRSKG